MRIVLSLLFMIGMIMPGLGVTDTQVDQSLEFDVGKMAQAIEYDDHQFNAVLLSRKAYFEPDRFVYPQKFLTIKSIDGDNGFNDRYYKRARDGLSNGKSDMIS